MDANATVTQHICDRLNTATGEDLAQLEKSGPHVQVLSIKKVGKNATNDGDRYRIIVSDGEYFLQAMLATQINPLVDNGQMCKNSIVRLDKFSVSTVKEDKNGVKEEKRLLIVLGLTPLRTHATKIGEPQPPNGLNGEKAGSASGTPAPETVPAHQTPQPHAQATTPAPPKPQPQMATSSSHHNVFPIEGLSPYQNNWTIRAKVKTKSDIRTYSNQRGEGKLFSVTLMDQSGEIKATAFNANVDQFYDQLQEGKTYFISKGRVNLAKKKFSNVNNEYELGFERSTVIEESTDGPELNETYNFVQLGDLVNSPVGEFVDVLGIVKEIGDEANFTSKAGNQMTKRELTIVDRSGASVRLTLWGKQATSFNVTGEPIIAWKSVKVGDFGGRSLSMLSSSSMTVNPDIPGAHVLRGWYDAEGSTKDFQPQTTATFSSANIAFNRSEIRLLDDVRNAQLGQNDKADYFSARATIMHIKSDNIAYPACQTEGCNKKVVESHEGWRCEKCNKVFERPSYRYIVSMAVADHSGQAWFQGFNDVGNAIFGLSADQVMEIKDRDDTAYNKLMENAVATTFNFTCRAKMESFQEQSRVRYGIQKILPLDYKEEGNYFKELLSSRWAQ